MKQTVSKSIEQLDDRTQQEFVINLFVCELEAVEAGGPGLTVPCLLFLRSKEAGLFLGDAVLPLCQRQLGAVPPAGGKEAISILPVNGRATVIHWFSIIYRYEPGLK